MKTLTPSVLILALVASPGLADPDPVPESEWERLDREIGELSASLSRAPSQTHVGGLVRIFYSHSPDDAFERDIAGDDPLVNSGNDLGGFLLKDADLFAEGAVTDEYTWRISFDLDDGDADLEDAWARYDGGYGVQFLAGSFKAPVLQSNRVDPEDQLFPDRTFLGQIFDFWNEGAMLAGQWNGLAGFLAVQNGFDGATDDLLVSGRGEYNLNGGTGRVEGAYGADDDVAATIGAMWFKDESDFAEGDAFGGDVSVTSGPFSFHGEIVNVDGELLAAPVAGPAGSGIAAGASLTSGNQLLGETFLPLNYAEMVGAGFETDDATIWNSTVSFLIDAMDLELGLRFESYDDPGNTRSATVGANWYRSGHNAVWHAGITQVSSNDVQAANTAVNANSEGVGDATLFQVGLSLGTTTKGI